MIVLSIFLLVLGIGSFLFAIIEGEPGAFIIAVFALIASYLCAVVATEENKPHVKTTIVGKDSIYVLEDGKVIATVAAPKQPAAPKNIARDYKIDVNNDSVTLYDGGRYVGAVPFGNTPFDSLIIKDNY